MNIFWGIHGPYRSEISQIRPQISEKLAEIIKIPLWVMDDPYPSPMVMNVYLNNKWEHNFIHVLGYSESIKVRN